MLKCGTENLRNSCRWHPPWTNENCDLSALARKIFSAGLPPRTPPGMNSHLSATVHTWKTHRIWATYLGDPGPLVDDHGAPRDPPCGGLRSVGGGLAPTDRPLHHPRPGIYNAVLRSDRFGTGHRLGIQNAPAGGPLQITDHFPFSTSSCLFPATQSGGVSNLVPSITLSEEPKRHAGGGTSGFWK